MCALYIEQPARNTIAYNCINAYSIFTLTSTTQYTSVYSYICPYYICISEHMYIALYIVVQDTCTLTCSHHLFVHNLHINIPTITYLSIYLHIPPPTFTLPFHNCTYCTYYTFCDFAACTADYMLNCIALLCIRTCAMTIKLNVI